MTSKVNQILNTILPKKNNLEVLKNLTDIPKKDNKINMPSTLVFDKDASHQLDILYLPTDRFGFKYALTVVDVATSAFDAEPLKTKSSGATLAGLMKIYKRKYLNTPARLEVDDGSEFKGGFQQYFDAKKIQIIRKKPGRHRQQSVIESFNGILGEILLKLQLNKEIETDKQSKEWVKILPTVVKLINEKYTKPEPKIVNFAQMPRCSGDSCKLFDVGDKVRIILDEPRDTEGKKLKGKFRKADLRWSRKVYTIDHLNLRPNQPPLYMVSGLRNVAYTKNQLQKID